MADALVEHHVELGLPERGRNLVLDPLPSYVVPDDCLAFLDRSDPADVEPERRVELEGLAAGGGLGISEHDSDFFAKLIDEHHSAIGAIDGAGQLPQCLTHEPSLKTHVALAHLTFDLRLG